MPSTTGPVWWARRTGSGHPGIRVVQSLLRREDSESGLGLVLRDDDLHGRASTRVEVPLEDLLPRHRIDGDEEGLGLLDALRLEGR